MSEIAVVQKKMDRLEEKREVLRQQALTIFGRQTLKCVECRKRSQVRFWTFIQMWHYILPSGCTDGDYWLPSETKVCGIVCPKCEAENYIYTHPEKEKILALIEDADKKGFTKRDIFKESVRKDRSA